MSKTMEVIEIDPAEGMPRIPCAVCGRKSSGFHYGADTCGACKIFFRRNFKRDLEHKCKGSDGSSKSLSDKNHECTKCRFERCLSVGMSIEASKKGRYTFIRKHRYIMQSLELQRREAAEIVGQDCRATTEFHSDSQAPQILLPNVSSPSPTTPANNLHHSGVYQSPNISSAARVPQKSASESSQLQQQQQQLRQQQQLQPYKVGSVTFHSSGSPPMSSTSSPPRFTPESFNDDSHQSSSSDSQDGVHQIPPAQESSVLCYLFQEQLRPENPVYSGKTTTSQSPLKPVDFDDGTTTTLFQDRMSAVRIDTKEGELYKYVGSHDTKVVCKNHPEDLSVAKYHHQNAHAPTEKNFPTTATPSSGSTVTINYPAPTTRLPPTGGYCVEIPTSPATVHHEVETLASHISKMFLQAGTFPKDFFELLPQREKKYLEYKSLSHDIIGAESELSFDDYSMIYHDTGVDIDGRLRLVKQRVMSYARRLATYLMFMAKIPGFQNIPEIDRDAVASASRTIFGMLSEYPCFNSELGLYTSPEGHTYNTAELKSFSPPEYIETLFRVVSYLDSLRLTEYERNLLKCIALFSPDDCLTVEGATEAEKQRQFYIQMFNYVRRDKPCGATIPDLLDTLNRLRKIIGDNCETFRAFVLQSLQTIDWNLPPGMLHFIWTGNVSLDPKHSFKIEMDQQSERTLLNAHNKTGHLAK